MRLFAIPVASHFLSSSVWLQLITPIAGTCHKHNNTTSKTQTLSPFFAVSCIPLHALFIVGQSLEVDEAFRAPSMRQGQLLPAHTRSGRSCWVPCLQDHTKPPSLAVKAPPTLIYSHRTPFHFEHHPVIYMIWLLKQLLADFYKIIQVKRERKLKVPHACASYQACGHKTNRAWPGMLELPPEGRFCNLFGSLLQLLI